MGQHGDAVGQLLGLAQIVGGQNQRRPAAQRADAPAQLPPGQHVQPQRRLVQRQHGRIAQQRHGDAQPPLPSSGQALCPLRTHLLKPQLAQRRFRRPARMVFIHAAHAGHQLQILPHRQVLGHGALLRRKTQRRARLGAAGGMTHDEDLARIGGEQPGGQLQRRGLARAVQAQQRQRAALGHLQREIVHRRAVAEPLRQVPDFQRVHGRSSFRLCKSAFSSRTRFFHTMYCTPHVMA